ncbi:Putative ATP-dependent RNA helicase [Echinococcus granulosus]|uniref:RNA helicase n=1 Tax=Echinococcus granulosus TaxID=6210 RepID=U6JFB2_ECHGR|nr:Putative ATP-dependent RNA helicase [Echinococcus granulosus]EUB56710.1 Putative ATP-dependent RNA helicase [Echinococcus granulosus]CDS22792.1 ATP dependent RNA helicase DDX47 [Echinococcus granulosus]
MSSFACLGVCEELCDTCKGLGWKKPTDIQFKVIPFALQGKDIVGLAETGSGKTGAFAIPILQNLLRKPHYNYALILTPTRELALQIRQHFLDIGSKFGLKVLCLVGGQHVEDQHKVLKNTKHHIIVGTPGRIVYHIENSKELCLQRIRYFVLDEADRMLGGNFDSQLETILSKLPEKRKTYLFSATMSGNLEKLQTACLRMPVRLETAKKYTTVDNLDHAFVFLPDQRKDAYVVKLLADLCGSTCESRTIVFVATARESVRLGEILRFITSRDRVVILNGLMRQDKRGVAFQKFKSGEASVMVATDLASRGLDIPEVQLVINYDIPSHPASWSEAAKDYIHRVGRTARAGRPGRAVSLVTPYSVTRLKIIESTLGYQITQLAWVDPCKTDPQLLSKVAEAAAHAKSVIRASDKRQKRMEMRRSKKRKLDLANTNESVEPHSEESGDDI